MSKMIKKNMVDGKNRQTEKPSIEEVLGVTASNPFKTANLEDFQEKLNQMHLADMQALAVKAGLLPVHDRKLMKERLTREFRKKLAKMKARVPQHANYKAVKNQEKSDSELHDILQQFRQ